MNLDPKLQALLWRFLLATAVVDLPVLQHELAQPVFDWRALLIGLIGGALAAAEKSISPQLADTYLPARAIPPVPPPAG